MHHNHLDAFNRVQNLEEEPELSEADHISSTYEYLRKNLNPALINPQNISTNIMFVGIDLSHDDDEQHTFDTINPLGVKLTTAELLKNYFAAEKVALLYPGEHDYINGNFVAIDDKSINQEQECGLLFVKSDAKVRKWQEDIVVQVEKWIGNWIESQ